MSDDAGAQERGGLGVGQLVRETVREGLRHGGVLGETAVGVPAGEIVPVALASLDRGGTLAIAGIHLTDVPVLDYQRHLFRERTVTSVTANTRADGEEFLRLARSLGIRPRVTTYPFAATDTALDDLANGRVEGAAVIELARGGPG